MLLIGLGDKKLLGTRGNIGAMVLDTFVDNNCRDKLGESVVVKGVKYSLAYVANKSVMVMKPSCHPDKLEKAVTTFVSLHSKTAEEVVVIHDDIDFTLGKFRLKNSGGDAGHPGIIAIAKALKTKEFKRLRVGVGKKPRGLSRTEYLSDHFSPHEYAPALCAIRNAALSLNVLIAEGMKKAQGDANKGSPIDKEKIIKEKSDPYSGYYDDDDWDSFEGGWGHHYSVPKMVDV